MQVQILETLKLEQGMMAPVSHTLTILALGRVKAGGSGVQGLFQPHTGFEATLGYMRPGFKKKINKGKNILSRSKKPHCVSCHLATNF